MIRIDPCSIWWIGQSCCLPLRNQTEEFSTFLTDFFCCWCYIEKINIFIFLRCIKFDWIDSKIFSKWVLVFRSFSDPWLIQGYPFLIFFWNRHSIQIIRARLLWSLGEVSITFCVQKKEKTSEREKWERITINSSRSIHARFWIS